jgi:hypothetical protein
MPHCLLDGMEGAAHFSAELHGIELSVGRLGKDGAGAAIPAIVMRRKVCLFGLSMEGHSVHTELRTHPVGRACDVAQRQPAWLEWKGGDGSLRHETTGLAT